jgi:hypothetical protein
MCSFSFSFSILLTFSFSPEGLSSFFSLSSTPLLSIIPVTISARSSTARSESPRDRVVDLELDVREDSVMPAGTVPLLTGLMVCSPVPFVVPSMSWLALPMSAAGEALGEVVGESVGGLVFARVSERFSVPVGPALWEVAGVEEVRESPVVALETSAGSWDLSAGSMLRLAEKPARGGSALAAETTEGLRSVSVLERWVLASVSERFSVPARPAVLVSSGRVASVGVESVMSVDEVFSRMGREVTLVASVGSQKG